MRIFQIDAFADTVFRGNPAAVVPLDEWLPDAAMQNIAAENNLAETAFFVKSGDAFEICWFTPAVEIPLCGHATLASAYVLFNELGYDRDEIIFKSRTRGELRVARDGDRFELDFPAYEMREIDPIAGLASAEFSPLKYYDSSQGDMLFLLMDGQSTVADLDPDMQKIAELSYGHVIVMAEGDDCDYAVRMFAPNLGIDEDPVTGGLQCSLIPFWAERLGKTELFARQVSKRGGELFCRAEGDRVKIGGNAVLYLKGEIHIKK